MLRFTVETSVARPPPEVFAFLADPEQVPRWNSSVVDVTRVAGGEVGVGAVYRQVRRADEQRLRVVEWDPWRRVAFAVLDGRPEFRRRLTFDETDGGTRVRDEWELDTGLPARAEALALPSVRDAARAKLELARVVLERGDRLSASSRS